MPDNLKSSDTDLLSVKELGWGVEIQDVHKHLRCSQCSELATSVRSAWHQREDHLPTSD